MTPVKPGSASTGKKQPDGKAALLSKGQTTEAPKPESRPMEPSRVVEVQFFKDGIFGQKRGAKRIQTSGHIDLTA